MNEIAKEALDTLYHMLKQTKISLANAEKRNARQDEMEALHRKIRVIDYLIELTLKEDITDEH